MKFLEFLGAVKQVPTQFSFARSMASRYVITPLALRPIPAKTHALGAEGDIVFTQRTALGKGHLAPRPFLLNTHFNTRFSDFIQY
jgi:hypothetical protein